MLVFEECAPGRASGERLRKTRRWGQSTDVLIAEKNDEGLRSELSGDPGGLGRPRRGRRETADQLVDIWCHCLGGEDADYGCAVVKAIELPFRPRDLPMCVASNEGGIANLFGDRCHLCREVIAAPQPRGDAVEE